MCMCVYVRSASSSIQNNEQYSKIFYCPKFLKILLALLVWYKQRLFTEHQIVVKFALFYFSHMELFIRNIKIKLNYNFLIIKKICCFVTISLRAVILCNWYGTIYFLYFTRIGFTVRIVTGGSIFWTGVCRLEQD